MRPVAPGGQFLTRVSTVTASVPAQVFRSSYDQLTERVLCRGGADGSETDDRATFSRGTLEEWRLLLCLQLRAIAFPSSNLPMNRTLNDGQLGLPVAKRVLYRAIQIGLNCRVGYPHGE